MKPLVALCTGRNLFPCKSAGGEPQQSGARWRTANRGFYFGMKTALSSRHRLKKTCLQAGGDGTPPLQSIPAAARQFCGQGQALSLRICILFLQALRECAEIAPKLQSSRLALLCGKKRTEKPVKHEGFLRKNTTSWAGIFPQNKSEKFRLFLRTFFQKVVAFS